MLIAYKHVNILFRFDCSAQGYSQRHQTPGPTEQPYHRTEGERLQRTYKPLCKTLIVIAEMRTRILTVSLNKDR